MADVPTLRAKSQQIRILNAIAQGWLSPMDALRRFGCLRLAARICELREAGWQISDRWVERDGKRFKQYRIVT